MNERDGPCDMCGLYHDYRDDLVKKPAVHPLVAAERARIRDAVEGLLFEAIMDGRGGVRDSIDRAAVLAIIDREDTE